MFQPKTMQETIMPLLVANFLVGTGIWTSKRGRAVNIAYSLFCLVSYCVMMQLAMQYMDFFMHKVNSLGDITFRAIFYANICLTVCLVPSGWLRREYMKAAMMRIAMCEKTMEQMGLPKNYRRLYLNLLVALGFVVVIFIVFVVVNYDGMFIDDDVPMYIRLIIMFTVNYPVGLLYVSDVSFLHWVRYSRIRFEQLNNLLQGMLTTTPDSPQHKRVLKMKDEWNKTFVTTTTQQDNRTKDNTDTMRAVKQVHLELIKSTRSTNEAYGLQILLSMTVAFVFITTLLYYAYSIFWLDLSREVFRQEMIPLVCWILFYSSKVLVINHMCAVASIEAANTGDIICELYEPSTSKEFRAEIRDFTLQLIQNPLVFTACGFFNLDHTFIHGVIGSVTTYLVILIQVGELPSSKPSANSTAMYNGTNFTMFDTFTTDIYV